MTCYTARHIGFGAVEPSSWGGKSDIRRRRPEARTVHPGLLTPLRRKI